MDGMGLFWALFLMDFLEGHISLVLASCHGKIITANLAFYRIVGLDPQKSNHASEIYIPQKSEQKHLKMDGLQGGPLLVWYGVSVNGRK